MNGRNKLTTRVDSSREGGGFAALPWSVLDSTSYRQLSYPARALLLEFARQVNNNNGQLIATRKYLLKRGWKSADVLNRAKKELLDAELIYETVMGHRPNKASWYAVTWYRLEKNDRYDAGVDRAFRRGMYRKNEIVKPVPVNEKP
jgi:hypothetical protein